VCVNWVQCEYFLHECFALDAQRKNIYYNSYVQAVHAVEAHVISVHNVSVFTTL
jgi:hypothetical protein